MKNRHPAISGVLLALLWAAKGMAAQPQLPVGSPSPLLFVRIDGPPALRTTFFQPGTPARPVAPGGVFGLRPGYIYQMELSGLPARPDLPDAASTICPTLEVRGS